jgi:hypothetical protein
MGVRGAEIVPYYSLIKLTPPRDSNPRSSANQTDEMTTAPRRKGQVSCCKAMMARSDDTIYVHGRHPALNSLDTSLGNYCVEIFGTLTSLFGTYFILWQFF